MRRAQPRHQDPQVVVNLGHGADGRAGRVPHVLLLDRDGRRQTFDVIERRLLHLADELPGVGAEALDVTPLPFGVDGVHRQRALARSAHAAADRHLVARNFDVDALEIVLPGAADANRLRLRHCRLSGAIGAALSRVALGRRAVEIRQQRLAGVRSLDLDDFRGRAGRDQLSAGAAPFRSQIDHPVGRFHHVQIVLDHQHGVAGVDEVVQHLQQQLDVGKVQPGRRLVEQIQCLARCSSSPVRGPA